MVEHGGFHGDPPAGCVGVKGTAKSARGQGNSPFRRTSPVGRIEEPAVRAGLAGRAYRGLRQSGMWGFTAEVTEDTEELGE